MQQAASVDPLFTISETQVAQEEQEGSEQEEDAYDYWLDIQQADQREAFQEQMDHEVTAKQKVFFQSLVRAHLEGSLQLTTDVVHYLRVARSVGLW